MNDLRTAAQQALEALEGWNNYVDWVWPESALEQSLRNTTESITALKAALAEPEHKPHCALLKIPSRDCDCGAEPVQDGDCQHCTNGCPACDARKLPMVEIETVLTVQGEPVQEPTWKRTVLTIQGESVPLGSVARNPFTFRCPNCASLEAQNTELDRKLAEMERQPVAWVCYGSSSDEKHAIDYQQEDIDAVPVGTMLYTAPPQRKPLAQSELLDLYAQHAMYQEEDPVTSGWWTFARAIERAHGIGGQDD